MSYLEEYQQKLTTAEEAVKVIKSGDWLDYGWSICSANALDKALANRMEELTDVNIRGGILTRRPAIFDVPNAADHFTWNSWHMSGIERKAVKDGFSFYIPLRYSELPGYYRNCIKSLDVAMFQVAPMDEHGYFNFGPGGSHMKAVCECAKTVIVEVNKNMPICLGGFDNCVHISDVDMIVEGENPPMETLGGSGEPSDVDLAIANLVVPEIPDGACLQLGIGSVPNTIGKMIAKSDLKDLGVHTEMYVDAFVDMAAAGKLTGLRKPFDRGRQVYAFAAGSQKLYDYINNNPRLHGRARQLCQRYCPGIPDRQLHLHQRRGGYRPVRSGVLRVLRRAPHLWRRRPAGLCYGRLPGQGRQELHLLLLHRDGQEDRQNPVPYPPHSD